MKLKVLISAIVSIIIWPESIVAQSELIPMIEIPAGNFYMGTLGEDENYDEAPMHSMNCSALSTRRYVVKMVFQVKMMKRWCT